MASKHFNLKELVSREVYDQYGKEAWKLFDQRAIDTIDFIRDELDLPITVNNWSWGGDYQLRGYRPERCHIGAANSAHKQGMAFDFDVKGMTADDVRQWLKDNESKLPYPIRCEAGVNWVHIDTRAKQGHKLYFFNP